MTENHSVLDNVLGWLHEGYPEGVPQKDYFPLLALLKRSLTEEEVVKAAQAILRESDSDTVTEDEIREAVHAVIEKEPNPEEIHQVAARLASVGWPLAAPARCARSASSIAPQRVVLGYLDEDQLDAVRIDDV
jgi:hypothetical protein